MKKFLLIYLFLLPCNCLISQSVRTLTKDKPALALSDLEKWPCLKMVQLSDDGRFVIYTLNKNDLSSIKFVVRDTANHFRIEIPGNKISNGLFSENSKRVYVMVDGVIFMIDLYDKKIDSIRNVAGFKVFKSEQGEWLAYKQSQPINTLVVRNLMSTEEKKFRNVADYWFFDNGNSLILKTTTKNDLESNEILNVLNLNTFELKTILEAKRIFSRAIIDKTNKKVAFLCFQRNGQKLAKIAYYDSHLDLATIYNPNSSSLFPDSTFEINNIDGFNTDGTRVIFRVKRKINENRKQGNVDLRIWNYLDSQLPSRRIRRIEEEQFACSINLQSGSVVRLEQYGEHIFPNDFLFRTDGLFLLRKIQGDENEYNWNKSVTDSVFVMSIEDGARQLVTSRHSQSAQELTPSGKFVIYYDDAQKNYFSYEISSGKYINITKNIDGKWWRRNDDPESAHLSISRGIAGFTETDKVLIYDQNDIYLADPSGQKLARCITKKYGRKMNMVFRLIADPFKKEVIKDNENLFVSVFNLENKNDGFASIRLDKDVAPEFLVTSNCRYVGISEDSEIPIDIPQRSKKSNVFLVQKSRAEESPNYYYTTDFKNFHQVTDNYPERLFNWITADLIRWKVYNGTDCQGILYKPENFDSTKKYPVIFYYYERHSNRIFAYPQPELSEGPLSFGTISYLVSNGYIVCVPDIHYKIGYPGRSAFNCVLSAVDYLLRMPWVNRSKIGIQGHSFGGFETCYLITHTNKFAAACAASPMTDFISAYGSVIAGGWSRQRQYEYSRDRIGRNLWEGLNLYVENSPVLRANNVTTPLLMMANDQDGDVPWQQGLEFFTALRRLGKRAWMLQYQGEDHLLGSNSEQLDYTIRMLQFFDHYLKGFPAPKWMTRPSPDDDKFMVDKDEYDHDIRTPGYGLLMKPQKENK